MKQALMIPIDKAGRVVLPKEVRDELAIQPGDLLQVCVRGGEVALVPQREKTGFIRRGRALVFSTGEVSRLDNETVEGIRSSERDRQGLETARGLLRRKRP